MSITQLGVNGLSAIYTGNLADEPAFLGTATAEIVSIANNRGGWGGGSSNSINSGAAWSVTSGSSNNGAGFFAFSAGSGSGGVNSQHVHRTILSGY